MSFRGQCLSVRCACPSHLGSQADGLTCRLPLGGGTELQGEGRESKRLMSETSPVYLAGPRFTEKNAFQMHSKHGDVIRMEKAVKSIWLLREICLYMLIASSFSFISSGTWLPNERIDYLSWMHISQLKALKACKISTASRPLGGCQHHCR